MNLASSSLESFLGMAASSSSTLAPQKVHLNSCVIGSKSWSASRSVNCLSHAEHLKLLRLVASRSSVSIFFRMWSSLYLTMLTKIL